MSAALLAALALLGKDVVLQPTNTVDVAATGCRSEAVLYVNGCRRASAMPSGGGFAVFPGVRLDRGVTDIRVESGAESDSLSWRYGETESEAPGASPAWRENPRDAWFREARFGLFVHWGLYSIPAKGEWGFARGVMPQDEYKALAKSFNPTNYNPALWARLAKAAGMKYVVFTTRHHDGFCMFDSHFTDYKITNTPYGKDVLKMLVEAFRAEGLRIGLYHSLPDWTHDGYVDLETPTGIKTGKCGPYDPERHAALRELVRNHVNQLTTEYGKIDLMFFDYVSKYKAEEDYFDRAALIGICRRNQPEMLVNDRLSYFKDGDAPDYDYYTPEVTVPSRPPLVRGTLRTWETCATMNDHWGYARDDHDFKSVETIVAGLAGCVSRGGNLLLNIGPTELGEFPPESVARLRELADWFSANGESVAGCGPSEYVPPFGCAYTQKGDSLYLHVLTPPMGDLLLPGLRGKVASATLLRTGKTVPQTHFWGFETLRPDELRLHPQGLVAGDVIKLELLKPFPGFSAPRAITSGPRDHFFANYFAINAWSSDNRYALVLETDVKDRLPDGEPCTLGLVDTADGNRFIPVTTTRCWNFQEAAMAHWMPCEKDVFVFNDMRDGKFCAVVMNWKTKEERVYPHPVAAVSEDGSWALSINYARLFLARPDYGYAGEGQNPRRGVVFPEDDGLWRVDLKTGEAKLLVGCAALKDMVPPVPETGLSYICHAVISKDMKRIYFLSRSVSQSMEGVKKFKGVNWHTTAFTCNADGTEVRRCFPDGWGSSHFNWKPALSERDARTMIVTCNWLNRIYTHVEFTVGEEDRPRQIGGREMDFDGHCIYSPDGKFISSDGYWDDKFFRHWKMVRLADGKVMDIGDFFVPERYRDVYCRCDLHPRWRPDGKMIGFNSVHEGSRQVYVIDVK